MHQYHVKQSRLSGELTVPPSKSHTLRAILFGSFGKGKTRIYNYLAGSDTTSMIDACRCFGATIDIHPDRLEIEGTEITGSNETIYAGNSGIVLRFCSALAALSSKSTMLTADASKRPMKELIKGLRELGAKVESDDSFAPITIKGPLKGGSTTINGEDSQPVSALLIACALAEGPSEIHVENPGEKPWIALTLDWLRRLGLSCENREFTHYLLPGNESFNGFDYTVPGDFSSAAFPLVAALVTGSSLTLKGIDMSDTQGDKEIINVLRRMGAEIKEEKRMLFVQKSTLKGIAIDINPLIDAITILSVVGCFAVGETHIYNGTVARQKECNRISAICTELKKMGANIEEREDGLVIRPSNLRGAAVHSYDDHRMAMSLAVAALGASGTTTISPISCVAKTFPSFLKDFQSLGASVY